MNLAQLQNEAKKLNANTRTLYNIIGMFIKHQREFDMLGKSKKFTKLIDIYNRYDKSSDAAAKYKKVTGDDLPIDWNVVDIIKWHK